MSVSVTRNCSEPDAVGRRAVNSFDDTRPCPAHGRAVFANPTFFPKIILHLDAMHDGAMNMAVDQAWLEHAPMPVLRVYTWDRPTVTLGYAQNLARIREALPPWPVVRRWTGGGVVMHEADYTYSIIVPATHPWSQVSAVESYRLIHSSLAEALDAGGSPGCRLTLPEDVVDGPLCFTAPALHDVLRNGVKVAGAGQRRGRLGLLHQGSVQHVTIQRDFWLGWAARLASEVSMVREAPPEVFIRASELAAKRFSLPQWLSDREDLLD